MLNDTITALATPNGEGALGIVRISGEKAFDILGSIFFCNKEISQQEGGSLLFGKVKDKGELIDEVLVSIFRSPKSYTGEDLVEICCHGSQYILNKIIQLIIAKGGRLAKAGEFTLRAFLNKKLDLVQAEAIADLISSEDESSHRMALQQMRGGYSREINNLREQLIDFASLIELELDFAEEDARFADRTELLALVNNIKTILKSLVESFKVGNAIKQGIPITIAGQPNSGKSSLLNCLLNEDKAIVSTIPGTTRDVIEDTITISGIKFRFLDTAGIRDTADEIEIMGIKRSFDSINKSDIVLYLVDLEKNFFQEDYKYIEKIKVINPKAKILLVPNKKDVNKRNIDYNLFKMEKRNIIEISAKNKEGIDTLKQKIVAISKNRKNKINSPIIVTNTRHYEHFLKSLQNIEKIEEGITKNLSGDLLSFELKDALYHLGQITGNIDVDTDILGNIFGKFCIGK